MERLAVTFFVKKLLLVSFGQKSSGKKWIFLNRLVRYLIPHCLWELERQFSPSALIGSVCLMPSYIGKVVIDRGRKFQAPKILRRRVIGGNNWKSRFFEKASATLSHFSGLICLVWYHLCCLTDGIRRISCIQVLAETFPQDFGRYLLREKMSFQIKFCIT